MFQDCVYYGEDIFEGTNPIAESIQLFTNVGRFVVIMSSVFSSQNIISRQNLREPGV